MEKIDKNILKKVDEDGYVILGHGLYLECPENMKGYQIEHNIIADQVDSSIEIDNADYDTYPCWLTTDDGQTPVGISQLEDLIPYLDQYYIFD